ncbi:MAG: hypothetical protein JRN32_03815 [Nitrososphaerota archaeon]|nr:hypothetical protein [Nitrososphaerota archaeon]MDG7037419.1 hypothetical protein [Nitrososphaerota archaeon]MDG7045928.1 hypothetical protein [Nitrososphaerota archaeon]
MIVQFEPYKKIIIKDYSKYERVDDLIKNTLTRQRNIPEGVNLILQWAEGIVFIYYPLPAITDTLSRELLQGNVYWDLVEFAPMKDYKEHIAPDVEHMKGLKADVTVIDVSNRAIMRDVAKYLSTLLKQE